MKIDTQIHNDNDVKTIRTRERRADGWRQFIAKQKPKVFITITPKQAWYSVNKLCSDANNGILKPLKKCYGDVQGVVCVESQGKRANKNGDVEYVPHLHFALWGKHLSRLSDKKIRNKILSLAVHGNNALFNKEYIDIKRAYNAGGLARYLTKECSNKTTDGYDTVSLLENGLVVKSEFTDVIAKKLKSWR